MAADVAEKNGSGGGRTSAVGGQSMFVEDTAATAEAEAVMVFEDAGVSDLDEKGGCCRSCWCCCGVARPPRACRSMTEPRLPKTEYDAT